MAEHSSPVLTGEVDTTAPFESVKEAVNLFGEKADPKALKFPSAEKRASLELQYLRENLIATRLQLSQAQAAKNSLFEELLETKRLVELKTSELAKVLTSKPSTSHVVREADEKFMQIEAASNAVKEKYEEAVANLASTEEEVERLNAEIESSVAAMEQGSVPGEVHAEHVDVPEVSDQAVGKADSEAVANAREMEKELAAKKESVEKLTQEIEVIKANLEKLKQEADEAKVSESKAKRAADAAVQELEQLKTKLSSLTEERNKLADRSESLRDELAKAKMEVAALREAESEVCATSPTVAAELEKVKTELALVLATEAKAKDTIAGVSQALQKVTFEADEARLAAEAALEEAQRAKQDLEEAKAAACTAESQLEAATREAQAAKASESMAQAELQSLKERASSSPSDKSQSKKEIESLRKRLEEAEDVAEMKVAAALAKVDAAKASERETRTKLEAARAEVESNKTLAKQALHRAETAEAAKNAIENELRRRRKAPDTTSTAGQGMPTRGSPFHGSVQTPDRRMEPPISQTLHRRSLDYTTDHSFVSADVSAESIAQLLQLKVSPPRKSSLAPPSTEKPPDKQKKSKSFMPKLGSYLTRRKSSVSSTSTR